MGLTKSQTYLMFVSVYKNYHSVLQKSNLLSQRINILFHLGKSLLQFFVIHIISSANFAAFSALSILRASATVIRYAVAARPRAILSASPSPKQAAISRSFFISESPSLSQDSGHSSCSDSSQEITLSREMKTPPKQYEKDGREGI